MQLIFGIKGIYTSGFHYSTGFKSHLFKARMAEIDITGGYIPDSAVA